MSEMCSNCLGEKPDDRYKFCLTCRKKWREEKTKTEAIWLFFWLDSLGSINCDAYRHNCVADYRGTKGFLGYRKIVVNMRDLKQ